MAWQFSAYASCSYRIAKFQGNQALYVSRFGKVYRHMFAHLRVSITHRESSFHGGLRVYPSCRSEKRKPLSYTHKSTSKLPLPPAGAIFKAP